MHHYAIFLPLILTNVSLFSLRSVSHVGGRTGHTAMPHQYASWGNTFPCATISDACSSGSGG